MSYVSTNEKKTRVASLVRELINNNEVLHFSRRLEVKNPPEPIYHIGSILPHEHTIESGILLHLRLETEEFHFSFSTEGWDDLLYYVKDKLEAAINAPQFTATIDANGKGNILLTLEVPEAFL